MCLTSVLDCGKLHFGFQDFFNPAMPLFLHLTHVIRSQPSNTHWNDFKRQLPLLIHVKRQPVLYQKQRCVCVRLYRPLWMYFVFSTSSHLPFQLKRSSPNIPQQQCMMYDRPQARAHVSQTDKTICSGDTATSDSTKMKSILTLVLSEHSRNCISDLPWKLARGTYLENSLKVTSQIFIKFASPWSELSRQLPKLSVSSVRFDPTKHLQNGLSRMFRKALRKGSNLPTFQWEPETIVKLLSIYISASRDRSIQEALNIIEHHKSWSQQPSLIKIKFLKHYPNAWMPLWLPSHHPFYPAMSR